MNGFIASSLRAAVSMGMAAVVAMSFGGCRTDGSCGVQSLSVHPLPPGHLRTPWWVECEVRMKDGIRNVYVDGENITQFPNPHHVYNALVSPSERYLLVWHMDFTPRRVSVYNLKTKELTSRWAPGSGGTIAWAAHDLIYHECGAGTNAHFFSIYDVDGKIRFGGGGSGVELCRSGRYVLVTPSLPVTEEEILVADVRNGDVIGRTRPADLACVNDYRWLDGRTIRFWYDTIDGEMKSVDIELRPDTPAPWTSTVNAVGGK